MLNAVQENKKRKFMFDEFVAHGHFTRSVITRPVLDIFEPADSSDVRLDFANLTVEKIENFADQIIAKSNQVYQQIVNLRDRESTTRLTFSNVIQPIINLDIGTKNMRCLCLNPSSFYTDEKIRDASTDATKKLSKFDIETEMRKDLYEVFEDYYKNHYPTEKASLSSQEIKYIEEEMKHYKRLGLGLPDKELDEVRKLKSRISDLQSDFDKNTNDDKTCFYFTRQELAGMPESWFVGKEMNSQSQYKLTLKYPDIVPALKYLEDRALRKTLCKAFNSRTDKLNTPIFNEVIRLRHQLAVLLGFQSFAQMKIEPKMAKTPEAVMDFLNDLNQKITPLFEKDMEALLRIARESTGDPNFKLQMWDMAYYSRIYEEKANQLDQEAVQKFFPLNVVTQGIFTIYERILGLKFFEKATDNKWHDSVKYFEVYDYDHKNKISGSMVGAFYLDMHPREGKYGHAAAFDFTVGHESQRQDVIKPTCLSVAAMACNFPENGCIPFDDVQTFFHEFGHVMHTLCSGRVEIPSMNGFHVERDFVETPSQMLENWVYETEALKLLSKHIETEQPIDEQTIQKLQKSCNFLEGYQTRRQIVFSLFDMKLHLPPVASQEQVDANKVFKEVYEDLLSIEYPDDCAIPATFGHLMHGYEAGYYGYKWALVNATDMYYEVFKGNPLSIEAGMHYRKTILEPGASKDAMDLLRDFLGREPTNAHYLQFLGLQEPELLEKASNSL